MARDRASHNRRPRCVRPGGVWSGLLAGGAVAVAVQPLVGGIVGAAPLQRSGAGRSDGVAVRVLPPTPPELDPDVGLRGVVDEEPDSQATPSPSRSKPGLAA